MRINAVNVAGGYTKQFYAFGDPRGGPTWVDNGTKYAKSGSCSSVVHGDHIKPNPWGFNIQESGDITGHFVSHDGPYTSVCDGVITNVDAAASLLSKANASDPYNKCLEKLYGKIRSDVDLSIDIYQGGQTIQMLKSIATTLANPTRALANSLGGLVRSGKIKRGSDLISRKWLEWQYGIKPTIATIFDLTGNMVELISDENGFYVVKARASSIEPYPAVIPRGSWSSVYNVKCVGQDSKRVEICIHYTIANAERNALSQFTSLNPASFIYENVPFSFVLDWIVDVGGYIRMMETALMTGLMFKSGYVTRTRRTEVEASVDDVYQWSSSRTYIAKGTGWAVRKSFDRTVLGAMPLPHRPAINIHLGSQRLFSAASLLRGLLKH